MTKRELTAAGALILGLLANACAAQTAWLLTYENASTNNLSRDPRIRTLLHTHLPAALSDDVGRALGGPPDPVFIVSGRYLSASACVPHDCSDKGFFWIDTQTGASLGATAIGRDVRLGSNSLRAASLPAPARAALLDWISDHAIQAQEVAFIGVDNAPISLDADNFQPRPRFQPPPGGPGFDCAAARTVIETTICRDPDLAQMDLAMQRRFTDGQQGWSTVPSRTGRRDLQRGWLAERDRTCTAASDRVACLKASYAMQADRLDRWVPSR